jgi:hypothetical protein
LSGSRFVFCVYVNGKTRKRSPRSYTAARDLQSAWVAQIKRGEYQE